MAAFQGKSPHLFESSSISARGSGSFPFSWNNRFLFVGCQRSTIDDSGRRESFRAFVVFLAVSWSVRWSRCPSQVSVVPGSGSSVGVDVVFVSSIFNCVFVSVRENQLRHTAAGLHQLSYGWQFCFLVWIWRCGSSVGGMHRWPSVRVCSGLQRQCGVKLLLGPKWRRDSFVFFFFLRKN